MVAQLVLESPQLRNTVTCGAGVVLAQGQGDTVRRRQGPGVPVAGRSVEGSPVPCPQIRARGGLTFLQHVSRLHGGLGGKLQRRKPGPGEQRGGTRGNPSAQGPHTEGGARGPGG